MAISPQILIAGLIGALAGCGMTYAMMTGDRPMTAEPSTNTSDVASERTLDGRIAVSLKAEERAHVRGEMLAFLQGIQTATYAIAESDRPLLGETAVDLSKGAGDPTGQTIRQKVPPTFREMSQSVRREFGVLANMAEEASFPELQQQLSTVMNGCVACHGSYGVVEQVP